jgi:hypothetical protein
VTEINEKDEDQVFFSLLLHVCFSMATDEELVEPTG